VHDPLHISGPGEDNEGPDSDGHTNHFEFAAGLEPTNPNSRFRLRVEKVPQKKVIFSPWLSDRTYVVKFKDSLDAANWSALSSSFAVNSGTERTVNDTSATSANRFYRVEITLP
jgi:hypothetical protein